MKLVILGRKSESTYILTNYLNKSFSVKCVFVENKLSKKQFFKRRIKKIGLATVLGQILFKILIEKPMSFCSKSRISQIKHKHKLDANIPSVPIKEVKNVNSPILISKLKEIAPQLVIVSGTRIISESVLHCIDAPFINIHAGITPRYRGVHGAYWALTENKSNLAGVTVHFIDKGIDTGEVIDQALIKIDKTDNFCTYPTKQLAIGLPMLKDIVKAISKNQLIVKESKVQTSKLWSHPTIFQYIKYFINGIK